MHAVLEHHIEISDGIRGGKPRIAGHRITVAEIVIMHFKMAMSPDEISVTYKLPLGAVYAALSYYCDHRGEIDESIEKDHAAAEAFRKSNPSLLQAKLQALKNG